MRLAFAKVCHAKPETRAAVERPARQGKRHSQLGQLARRQRKRRAGMHECGYPKLLIWVRIGDMGEYESFDSLDDALDYLNELKAGEVTGWVEGGMGVGIETVNYHGYDFVSIFWGDDDANLTAHL